MISIIKQASCLITQWEFGDDQQLRGIGSLVSNGSVDFECVGWLLVVLFSQFIKHAFSGFFFLLCPLFATKFYYEQKNGNQLRMYMPVVHG